MKKLVVTYLLFNLALIGQSQLPIAVDDTVEMDYLFESENEIIALAYTAVEEYALTSRLVSESGDDLSREFLALFGIDAKIPQDYLSKWAGESLVSPIKYTADYLTITDVRPLEVTTRILDNRTTVTDIGTGESKRVGVAVERTYSTVVQHDSIVTLKRPLSRRMEILLIVRPDGRVEIDGVRPLRIFDGHEWVVDLGFGRPLSSIHFSDLDATDVAGQSTEIKMRTSGINVFRRIYPFDAIEGTPAAPSLLLGLGLHRVSLSTPAMELSSLEVDYIEEDDVIILQTGESISDLSGSEDFVRQVEVEFEENRSAHTSVELLAAISITLIDNGRYSTVIDAGGGLRFGGKIQTEVATVTAYHVSYGEGPFENIPVEIDENGVYYGALFEPYSDPYGVYGLGDDDTGVSYTSRFATTPFIDVRIIESLDLPNADVGLVLSVRKYLGDLLDRNNEQIPLITAAREGIPPTFAFSEKIAPTLIYFGLRMNF